MIVSLVNTFTASAKGCHSPNGPTRFGPRRSWNAASALRSKYVEYAMQISTGTRVASVSATVSSRMPNMFSWKKLYKTLLRRRGQRCGRQ